MGDFNMSLLILLQFSISCFFSNVIFHHISYYFNWFEATAIERFKNENEEDWINRKQF